MATELATSHGSDVILLHGIALCRHSFAWYCYVRLGLTHTEERLTTSSSAPATDLLPVHRANLLQSRLQVTLSLSTRPMLSTSLVITRSRKALQNYFEFAPWCFLRGATPTGPEYGFASSRFGIRYE